MKFFIMNIVLMICSASFAENAKPSLREIVATCVVMEAGGESDLDMQAVMNVIINRSKQKNISGFAVVVLKPKQFSCFNNASPEDLYNNFKHHSCFNYALDLVKQAESGILRDVTDGATHYHVYRGRSTVKPSWTHPTLGGKNKKAVVTTYMDHHVFLKNVD